MSKSLGNGIDPLEMIDKYGADALRFNLVTGNSPGNDMRFYAESVRSHAQLCQQDLERQPLCHDEPADRSRNSGSARRSSSMEDKWMLTQAQRL